MKRNSTTMMTSVALGAMIGTAAYMMNRNRSTSKTIKRNATKAVKNAANFVDTMMSNIIK